MLIQSELKNCNLLSPCC